MARASRSIDVKGGLQGDPYDELPLLEGVVARIRSASHSVGPVGNLMNGLHKTKFKLGGLRIVLKRALAFTMATVGCGEAQSATSMSTRRVSLPSHYM